MRSLVVIVMLAGCGVTDFEIEQAVPEQRVMGSPLPGPLAALLQIPLDLDLAAEIQKRETGPIDSITLTSLELNITATDRGANDTDDWAFVEEIRVFVKSSQAGSSLPRVEIAHVAAPGAVQRLELEVEEVDLAPYVGEGSIVESEGRGTVPADDVSYDGKAVFTVHAL